MKKIESDGNVRRVKTFSDTFTTEQAQLKLFFVDVMENVFIAS
jgi:hypothetical protein